MLNDRIVPFYNKHEVPLLRILTDRGSEFCGRLEDHSFELFLNPSGHLFSIYCRLDLSVEGIDHSKTKAYSPQTNGICERFHKTMKTEFYDSAFRKKIYSSLDELQQDVDVWL